MPAPDWIPPEYRSTWDRAELNNDEATMNAFRRDYLEGWEPEVEVYEELPGMELAPMEEIKPITDMPRPLRDVIKEEQTFFENMLLESEIDPALIPSLTSQRKLLTSDLDAAEVNAFHALTQKNLMAGDDGELAQRKARNRISTLREAKRVSAGWEKPIVELGEQKIPRFPFQPERREPTWGETLGRQVLETEEEAVERKERLSEAQNERSIMRASFLQQAMNKLNRKKLDSEVEKLADMMENNYVKLDLYKDYVELGQSIVRDEQREKGEVTTFLPGSPEWDRALKLSTFLYNDFVGKVYPDKVFYKKPEPTGAEKFIREVFTEELPTGATVETRTGQAMRVTAGAIRGLFAPVIEGITYPVDEATGKPLDPADANYNMELWLQEKENLIIQGKAGPLDYAQYGLGYIAPHARINVDFDDPRNDYIITPDGIEKNIKIGIQKSRFLGDDFVDMPGMVGAFPEGDGEWMAQSLGLGIEVFAPITPLGAAKPLIQTTAVTIRGAEKALLAGSKISEVVSKYGAKAAQAASTKIAAQAAEGAPISRVLKAGEATAGVTEKVAKSVSDVAKSTAKVLDKAYPKTLRAAEIVDAPLKPAVDQIRRYREKQIAKGLLDDPVALEHAIEGTLSERVAHALYDELSKMDEATFLAKMEGIKDQGKQRVLNDAYQIIQRTDDHLAHIAKNIDDLPADKLFARLLGSDLGNEIFKSIAYQMYKESEPLLMSFVEADDIARALAFEEFITDVVKISDLKTAVSRGLVRDLVGDYLINSMPEGWRWATPSLLVKEEVAGTQRYKDLLEDIGKQLDWKVEGDKFNLVNFADLSGPGFLADRMMMYFGAGNINKSEFLRGLWVKAANEDFSALTAREMITVHNMWKEARILEFMKPGSTSKVAEYVGDEMFRTVSEIQKVKTAPELSLAQRAGRLSPEALAATQVPGMRRNLVVSGIRDFMAYTKQAISGKDIARFDFSKATDVNIQKMMGEVGVEYSKLGSTVKDMAKEAMKKADGNTERAFNNMVKDMTEDVTAWGFVDDSGNIDYNKVYVTLLKENYKTHDAVSDSAISGLVSEYSIIKFTEDEFVKNFGALTQKFEEVYPQVALSGYGGKHIEKQNLTIPLLKYIAEGKKKQIFSRVVDKFHERFPLSFKRDFPVKDMAPQVDAQIKNLLAEGDKYLRLQQKYGTLPRTADELDTMLAQGRVTDNFDVITLYRFVDEFGGDINKVPTFTKDIAAGKLTPAVENITERAVMLLFAEKYAGAPVATQKKIINRALQDAYETQVVRISTKDDPSTFITPSMASSAIMQDALTAGNINGLKRILKRYGISTDDFEKTWKTQWEGAIRPIRADIEAAATKIVREKDITEPWYLGIKPSTTPQHPTLIPMAPAETTNVYSLAILNSMQRSNGEILFQPLLGYKLDDIFDFVAWSGMPKVKGIENFETLKPRLLAINPNKPNNPSILATPEMRQQMDSLRRQTIGGTLGNTDARLRRKSQSAWQYAISSTGYALQTFNQSIKGGMLGGVFAPTMKYINTNVVTAPFIMAVTTPEIFAKSLLKSPVKVPLVLVEAVADTALEAGLKPTMGSFGVSGAVIGGIAGGIPGTALGTTLGLSAGALTWTLAHKLGRSNNVFNAGYIGAIMTTKKSNDVLFKTLDGVPITKKMMTDMIARNNLQFSQVSFEFGQSALDDIIRVMEASAGAKNVSAVKQTIRWLRPDKPNFWNTIAAQSDNAFRLQVFSDALKLGYNEQEAATLAIRSLFDYADIGEAERKYIAQYFLFYSFMRHSYVEVVSSMLKGDNAAMRNIVRMSRYAENQREVGHTDLFLEEASGFKNKAISAVWAKLGKSYDETMTIHYGPAFPAVETFMALSENLAFAWDLTVGEATPETTLLEKVVDVGLVGARPVMAEVMKMKKGKTQFAPHGSLPVRDAIVLKAGGVLDYAIDFFHLEPVPTKYLRPGAPTYDGQQYRFADKEGFERYRIFKSTLLISGLQRGLTDWGMTVAVSQNLEGVKLKRYTDGNWYLFAAGLETPIKAPNHLQLKDEAVKAIIKDLQAEGK